MSRLHCTFSNINLQYTTVDHRKVQKLSTKNVNLMSWKNDIAICQISIYNSSNVEKTLKFECNNLQHESNTKTILKDQIEFFLINEVQAFPGKIQSGFNCPYQKDERQYAADVMQKIHSNVVIAEYSLLNLWVRINVKEDDYAGNYQGNIAIRYNDQIERLKVNLEVVDRILPKLESATKKFDIEYWQNPYAVAEYYCVKPFSSQHFNILEPHMLLYKEIGGKAITATLTDDAWDGQTYSKHSIKYPSMIQWKKTVKNEWTFDYHEFDQWILFNQKLGLGEKIVVYGLASWAEKLIYFEEDSQTYKTIHFSSTNSEYEKMVECFLRDFMIHMESLSLFENTYLGIDERGFNQNLFNLIKSIVNEEGQSFKISGAMDAFVDKSDLALCIDDLSVGTMAIKENLEAFSDLINRRNQKKLKTTVYSCTGHFPGNFVLSAPGESYWTILFSFFVGTQGFLRWAYDSWNENPLEDTTYHRFESGDCFLIYPGNKDNINPIPQMSLRMEKMYEGWRDVQKLIILSNEMPEEITLLKKKFQINYETEDQMYLTDNAKELLANNMTEIKNNINQMGTK